MALIASSSSSMLLALVLLAVCLLAPGVQAFGAGNIPSIAYVEGKAFRHGDIEDIIATLVLSQGAISLLSKKFKKMDIKKIYFGNWLRDYSQAIDVGTLGKGMPKASLLTLVAVLGFSEFGYATQEFEVTEERLGCYRPEQHIDNPKGYAEGQDARRYDPNLRGPVDPRELEVDVRTGLKNYIGNEQGGWATSTVFVRRSIERSVQAYQAGNKDEAYRLLGQALHTMEDFPAHSNFVELTLIELGHSQVFPFVGENTAFRQGPRGPIYPVVTGTFGGMDFAHSLLGEATDHISSTSVSSLNKSLDTARSRGVDGDGSSLINLLGQVPGLPNYSREVQDIQRQEVPNDPVAIKNSVWRILELRDNIMKGVDKIIETIPGLAWLTEKISESLQLFILSLLEPFMKPVLQQVVGKLQMGSAEITESEQQREVFNNPNCSDPTHSISSKDHFDLYLNQPAGMVARVIVENVVQAVVKAWSDPSKLNDALNVAMQVFFHPADLGFPKTPFQNQIIGTVHQWAEENRDAIPNLSKASVMAGQNRRHPIPDGSPASGRSGCCTSLNFGGPQIAPQPSAAAASGFGFGTPYDTPSPQGAPHGQQQQGSYGFPQMAHQQPPHAQTYQGALAYPQSQSQGLPDPYGGYQNQYNQPPPVAQYGAGGYQGNQTQYGQAPAQEQPSYGGGYQAPPQQFGGYQQQQYGQFPGGGPPPQQFPGGPGYPNQFPPPPQFDVAPYGGPPQHPPHHGHHHGGGAPGYPGSYQ
ncbi:hypothetical protein HDU87_000102 [Geranomyces variabilis]|uniref:Het-C-domain-containing protein n=1 Tax=Geranomyces variabilis TaxID=109894 RepID=A0AAD5TWM5_9FUNG|nr:hypothetical protein HDU87_000102 [Geranomyces variabilis]